MRRVDRELWGGEAAGGDWPGSQDWAAQQAPEAWSSVCVFAAGAQRFSIDTSQVREVLGETLQLRVPGAPAFIGGVMTYHGEVLTTVSLRVVLGVEPESGPSFVLVLEDESEGDVFGLLADWVGGVQRLDRRTFRASPQSFGDGDQALFVGSYRTSDGLLVQLDPTRLWPARLAAGWSARVSEEQSRVSEKQTTVSEEERDANVDCG